MNLDTELVHRAREEFVDTGSVSQSLSRAVRPDILTSWRRSRAFGAEVGVSTLPIHDDLDRDGRLVRAAEPVLRTLAENLGGLDAGVLLADREANIIQRWVTETAILAELDRICSDTGFGAPEDRVGTNGIGTVAELGRPQMIVGPEHYANTLVPFTCVGAPIHSPTTRRLEGIITLSCRADTANALLTPLMVSVAADISNRLLNAATIDERLMLDAYIAARRPNRMVAAVGRDLLIAGARVTRMLDSLTHRDILWDLVAAIVQASGPAPHTLETHDGTIVRLTCQSVCDSGRLVGAIIEIDTSSGVPPDPVGRPRRSPTLTLDLPGRNARWLHVLETAARYAHGRVDVAVTGEPGAGKWTVVEAIVGAELEAPTTRTVNCCAPGASAATRDALATDGGPLPRLVVLRRLDALPEQDRTMLGARLAHLDDGPGRPWVVATACPPAEGDAESAGTIVRQLRCQRLTIPPLRERADDIADIARHLLARLDRAHAVHLSSGAMTELGRARWPGNIRELDAVLRAVTAGRAGEITAADLPPEVRADSTRRSLSPIEEMECGAIVQALHQSRGNKAAAAKIVGLSRSTIYRKIRAYGIDRDAAFF